MKSEMKRCRNLFVSLIVSMLLVVWLVPTCFAADAVEASNAIGQADRSLGSAYVAVAEADMAGANVSMLLDILDSAAASLSEANLAYRVGDYESAFSSAMACSNAVGGVVDDVVRLKVNAEIAHNAEVILTAFNSGIGIGVLLVCAFFGWRFLKRWYFKRILDMKPKVEGAK
jgi:hypothetical protein